VSGQTTFDQFSISILKNAMNRENTNTNILETLLLLFYNIDVKLTEVFNSTTVSFGKSSSLIKGIFKPLQKYGSNLTKLTNHSGHHATITPYLEAVKENMIVITTQLQFHDVLEQRLKHIRLIHNEIIQDIIAQKKSPDKRHKDDLAYIQMIAQINTAQISNIHSEYIEQCQKLDASLELLHKYLAECEGFSLDASAINLNDDLRFLASQNPELSNRIIISARAFATDVNYRGAITKAFAEINKAFHAITFEIKIKEKLPASHERLKKLETVYTTQGEREVFNNVVYAGSRIQMKRHSFKNDLGVEFF
jgi:hypothetical protein